MSPIQTNTQSGVIVRTAVSDLSAKEGTLAKISATGTLQVDAAGVGDIALYVIVDGGIGATFPVSVLPLDGSRNVRVISSGTIAAGVQVSPDANGKLRASITSDVVIGITEESSTVGQYTLIRPCNLGVHA